MLSKPVATQEAQKTREERAEDIAYTINHAVSCATTDMLIAPTVSALFGVQVGCADPSHDHGHDHHDHDHHGHEQHHDSAAQGHAHEPHPHAPKRFKLNWKLYRSEALHYFKGEVIGDLAAVPLTIMVQRFFPSVMNGIRHLIEPLAAPFFRRGADYAAKRWGAKQGLPEDAPEIVAHAQSMYQSEIKHLPQAVMWNLFAFPIGVIGQKLGGHGSSVSRIIRNKSIGALISNGILLGTRAFAPDMAERWDKMNSEHVIVPTTKVIGKIFGVRDEDVDRLSKQNNADTSWAKRVEDDQPPTKPGINP